MSYLTRAVVLLGLFCIFAIVCIAQEHDVTDTKSPRDIVERNEAVWKEFNSDGGRFSVLFPGNSQKSTQRVGDAQNGFDVHIQSLKTTFEYSVIYADYPFTVDSETKARELLEQVAKGAVAEVKAKVLRYEEITFDKYPGRYLVERLPDNKVMKVKMFLVGSRLYQIAVTTPEVSQTTGKQSEFYEQVAAKFLDSFKFLLQPSVIAGPVGPAINQSATECENPDVVMARLRKDKKKILVGTVEHSNGDQSNPEVGGVLNGKAVSMPKPVYPKLAAAAKASGTVVVQVVIDEEGKVIAAAAISGHPLLRASAVSAACQTRFSPTLLDGKPVLVTGTINYNFAPN